jgi:hypothetical protein
MERLSGTTDRYIMFATPRIADIVTDVLQESDWVRNRDTMNNAFFRNPVAAHLSKREK